MSARQRKSNESFENYRKNLKLEAIQDSIALVGTMVYQATNIIQVPSKIKFYMNGVPELENRSISRGPCRRVWRKHVDTTLSPTDRYYDHQ